MTQLINTQTLQVITESEFRALHSQTSFGPVINYPDFGYEVVFPTPSPTVQELEVARQIAPVKTAKGNYEQQWEVVPMFADTTFGGVVTTKAQHEVAYLAAKKKATVPQTITMRQTRLALLAANLLDDIDAFITSQGRAAAIAWEFATEVRRDNELVAAVQTLRAMTDDQIDDLFIAAGKL